MVQTLIVFDVDSTLLSVESLDFAVARALRHAPDGPERTRALEALTDQGMAGEIDFRTSLERRIAIAGLTRSHVDAARDALRAHVTPDMAELVSDLCASGALVFAVSGGFVDLIEPALDDLGFKPASIHANRFAYDRKGAVIGFETANPLSRSGGKADVVSRLKRDAGPARTVMIGDGMTDYEAFAAGAADHFIGFGGVKTRAAVKAKAPAWADSVEALKGLLLT